MCGVGVKVVLEGVAERGVDGGGLAIKAVLTLGPSLRGAQVLSSRFSAARAAALRFGLGWAEKENKRGTR